MQKPLALDNFNGPLELLLQLIEAKELEITTVSLAEVTEQFLSYLEEVEERLPQELADFLVVATKLLLLKSQALLPYLQVEEEEDAGNLAAQLKMYKKYAEATAEIEELLAQKQILYPKKVVKVVQDVHFAPPPGIDAQQLHAFFVEVLSRLEPVVRIPKTALAKVVSLREKLVQVQEALERHAKVHFYQLLADSTDRGDVVITFLAVLELVKQQNIRVKQDAALSTIMIEKIDV